MGRTNGSKNKIIKVDPLNTNMSLEARVAFLADLIADRIIKDQGDGELRLKALENRHESFTT